MSANDNVKKIVEDDARLAALVREWLVEIGEDPGRDGLQATPGRVAEAWRHFTRGYSEDVEALVSEGAFEDPHEGMVLVKGIDFYSVCEHHLVPFFGKCHVAYVPAGRILGLSKVARVVDVFARRLQVQERMTNQIANALSDHLAPRGVAVLVEAQHLCMMMRGVESHNSVAVTSARLGCFQSDAPLISEFYTQIGQPNAG